MEVGVAGRFECFMLDMCLSVWEQTAEGLIYWIWIYISLPELDLINWQLGEELGVGWDVCCLFPLLMSVALEVPHAVGEGGLLPQQMIRTLPHTTKKEVELLWFRTAQDQVVQWFRGTVCCWFVLQGQPALGLQCLCASWVSCLGFCEHLPAWYKLPKSSGGFCLLKAKVTLNQPWSCLALQVSSPLKTTPNSLSEYEVLPNGCEAHWEVVERILFIYAKLNPGIAYVQGMNEIVGPLYYTFATDPNSEWKGERLF